MCLTHRSKLYPSFNGAEAALVLRTCLLVQFFLFNFILLLFFKMYLPFRERQRERVREGQRERGRERIPSRLRTVSTEPDGGLEPANRETMT